MKKSQLADIEAERAVIGSMLIKADLVPAILGKVNSEVFTQERHRDIFGAIYDCFMAGREIDSVSVIDQLRQAGKNNDGTAYYIAGLTSDSFIPSASHVGVVEHLARKRSLLKCLDQARQELTTGLPLEAILETISDVYLAETEQVSRIAPIGDTLPETVQRIFKRADNPLKMAGIPSGFPDLDGYTSGLVQTNLIILASRPSVGKTTLALNIAENVARKDRPVAFFSLEMSRDELTEKLVSRASGVPLNNIRKGILSDDDRQEIEKTGRYLSSAPLFTLDRPALTISQLLAEVKHLHMRHKLALVVVDYIQLMTGTGQTREQEVASITRGLKRLAMDLNVPVIALSQLNRSLENRTNKRPTLADLRESGAIEQDANVVLFVYRDEVYQNTPDNPLAGITEINIAKNRAGEIGTVKLWSGRLSHSEFTSYQRGDFCK